MSNNSFSLIDLYPKYVINSKGEKKKFDENNIAKVLNKETGLDMHISEKVAEDVIRKIIGLGMDEITTNYIRELVCVELTQRGMNKYRNLFARAINLESVGFKLDEEFISKYKGKQPDWGPLGYITYKRTYARIIEEENRKEEFWETIRRVVEGCYSVQKEHCLKLSLPWSDSKAQKSARKMFEKIWNFKFLPPGRGLWMMGTEFIARHGSMSLNNCGFASTEDIALKHSKAFEFVMDALMLGVGVGFDTKGAGKITIKKPKEGNFKFQIPDSREGWVESLRLILEAYFLGKQVPIYDFSLIRPAGEPIRGFGGVASGPGPLKEMLEEIQKILQLRIGQKITSVDIVDIMNHIGKCVVAGNVRRCLPEGTLIHTKEGLIPIEKLNLGMLIETTKGYFPILEVINQGKQKLVKIKSQIGEFFCTKNHQIAVMTNIGQYSWKKAKDLKSGDRLVFPLHISEGKETKLPEWSYDKPDHSTTCKDIIIPPLDENMAWFLGYFHGDGCVIPNFEKNGLNAEINVAIDENHTLIVEKCREQLLRFGVNIYSSESEEKCVKLRCISKQLAWYFDHFKQAKKSIKIPDYILQGKPEIRAAYLGGLFDADGSSLTRPLHLVVTIYPEFAHQVKALYASLGIPTKIKKIDRSNKENWEDIYHVNLVGELSISRFIDLIKKYCLKYSFTRKTTRSQYDFGFPSEWILENNFNYGRKWTPKQKQMTVATYLKCGGQINNLIPIEVFEVKNNNSEEFNTYDISIANVHELIAGDGILVHNSAEIALGDPTDLDFITCKQDEESLYSHRWASNNSVFAVKGLDYSFIANQIAVNGEPGVFWLENAKAYSRMGDAPDFKDKKVAGVNPCGEQSLESFELCCLVETFPSRHESYDEFQDTLKYAYLYSKSVTLVNTHWQETNAVMLKNRRMGISQTGIIEAFVKHGRRTILEWCSRAYNYLQELDEQYSGWLCIPRSIKITTVKPSGTVSLLPGVPPGIHYPHSEYYIRRIRISKNSDLIEPIRKAGYKIEDDLYSPNTVIAEFPIHEKYFDRSKNEVSIWEQAENAAAYQKYWSDNQVSITITFKDEEADQIKHVLECYEDKLKSVSFLPIKEHGYKQAPYEEITQEQYEKIVSTLQLFNLNGTKDRAIGEKFCDSDRCEVRF
ncbi:MAG: LAGLIDADG family homing endonuclease [Candidatus Hodarchaeota archaeon]